MRSDIIIALSQNDDYWKFLRENPSWHQKLSRHPELFNEFKEEYKIKRRKRIVDKVEDAMDMINMLSMVMEEM